MTVTLTVTSSRPVKENQSLCRTSSMPQVPQNNQPLRLLLFRDAASYCHYRYRPPSRLQLKHNAWCNTHTHLKMTNVWRRVALRYQTFRGNPLQRNAGGSVYQAIRRHAKDSNMQEHSRQNLTSHLTSHLGKIRSRMRWMRHVARMRDDFWTKSLKGKDKSQDLHTVNSTGVLISP